MTEVIGQGRFLKLVKRDGWELVQRTTGREIVAICAVVAPHSPADDRKILLVEQFRIPVGARVLELPAGITGDTTDPETLEATARRELLEETGYEAAGWERLMVGPSSSGMSDEHITIFLAYGLRKVGKGGGVKGENITVHEVPIDKLHGWLIQKQKEGVMVDFKIYAALYASDQR